MGETNGVMRRSGKENKPDQNKRQGTTSASIVQVDVQATYSERKNETDKQAIMDNVVDNVEDNDNVFSDISQFISIDDNKEAFIFQMTVLCLSIVIGFGGAISRILHFRRNKTKQNEKNAKRNLAQTTFFEYLFPILGIYPAVLFGLNIKMIQSSCIFHCLQLFKFYYI